MGQKVNPNGLRLGVIKNWDARWYASNKEVPILLQEDLKIRDYIDKAYADASVSKVITERSKNRVIVTLYTAKPGMVIGREGQLKKEAADALAKLTGKQVFINVKEIRRPELDATLVAKNIASQLENRASFRRVQKLAIMRAMKAGAKGCKTLISGRLAGAEIARSEGYSEGNVPLHTLRANVDYAHTTAHTTYGALGVKVWIYKGEVLSGKVEDEQAPQRDSRPRRPRGEAERPRRGEKNVNTKEN